VLSSEDSRVGQARPRCSRQAQTRGSASASPQGIARCWRFVHLVRFFWGTVALIFPLLVLAQSEPHGQGHARTLDTPSYVVQVEIACAEGEVTCKRVTYIGRNKASGAQITLRGRTVHSLCADGVTPCRFLGYVFRNGAYTYFVGDAGELLVRRGKRIVVQESGSWR
jgi:hypothetical protein